MSEQPIINITIQTPIMTQEKFSTESGFRLRQTEGQAQLGNLPTYGVGKNQPINMAALTLRCVQAELDAQKNAK